MLGQDVESVVLDLRLACSKKSDARGIHGSRRLHNRSRAFTNKSPLAAKRRFDSSEKLTYKKRFPLISTSSFSHFYLLSDLFNQFHSCFFELRDRNGKAISSGGFLFDADSGRPR